MLPVDQYFRRNGKTFWNSWCQSKDVNNSETQGGVKKEVEKFDDEECMRKAKEHLKLLFDV